MDSRRRAGLDKIEFYLVRISILILTAISLAKLIGAELVGLFAPH